jgi:hypothetical protein
MKFSDIGTDNLKDSTTFKKIQTFSKSNPQKLYTNLDEFNLKYKKIADLYLNDFESIDTSTYATKRQHMYTSKQAILNNSTTYLDSKGFNTLLSYNTSVETNSTDVNTLDTIKFHHHKTQTENNTLLLNLSNKVNPAALDGSQYSFNNYLSFLVKNSLVSAETDSNQTYNPLKSALNSK